MSLVVAIKAPEGIVLAADSRVTSTKVTQVPNQTNPALPFNVVEYITFDNATKLLSFDSHNYVGAAEIGDRTAHSFLTEFLAKIKPLKEDQSNRLTVREFAKKLSNFYKRQWIKVNGTPQAGHQLPI